MWEYKWDDTKAKFCRDKSEDFITNPGENGDGLGTIYDWNLWYDAYNAYCAVVTQD